MPRFRADQMEPKSGQAVCDSWTSLMWKLQRRTRPWTEENRVNMWVGRFTHFFMSTSLCTDRSVFALPLRGFFVFIPSKLKSEKGNVHRKLRKQKKLAWQQHYSVGGWMDAAIQAVIFPTVCVCKNLTLVIRSLNIVLKLTLTSCLWSGLLLFKA